MTIALLSAAWVAVSLAQTPSWAPPRRLTSAYSDALVALGLGDVARARAGFAALVEDAPDCGMCVQGLGVSLLRSGETAGALSLLEDAAQRWPVQPEVWVSLSASAFAGQDFSRARSAAAEAVRIDPGSLDGQAALQQALLRVGALDEASSALEQARAELPDPVVACFEVQLAQEGGGSADPLRLSACQKAGTPDLVAGVLSRAGSALELGALAARLGLDPVVLVAQALDQHADGDTPAALALLDDVLRGWPHRADARALRAQLRADAGDTAGAQRDLETLLAARAWVDVHRSGAMSGILRKSDAERLRSTVSEAAALQIDLHLEGGDLDRAQDAWAALGDALEHPAPLAAGARLAVAQGDLGAAWKRVETGLAAFPTDPRPIAVAGAVALADPKGLTASAEAALSGSVDWRDGHNLALVYRRRGAPTKCFARTRTADAVSGLPGEARRRLRTLGYACAVEAGDLPLANEAFRRLSEPDRASPVARYNHALARYGAGDLAGAAAVLGSLPFQQDGLDATVVAAVRALGLRIAVQTADWRRATSLLESGSIAPADQIWCAEQMAQAGLYATARAVVGDCSVFASELAERCEALR